jgi:hypothetical protein
MGWPSPASKTRADRPLAARAVDLDLEAERRYRRFSPGMLTLILAFSRRLRWIDGVVRLFGRVALAGFHPEARSVVGWLRSGCPLVPAFIVGFFVRLWGLGWQPAQFQ